MLRRLALTALLSALIAGPLTVVLGWGLGLPVWGIALLGLAVYVPVFAWTARAEAQRRREGYHLAA